MIRAIAHIESLSPYSQSRKHDTPKLEKEHNDDHEKRTWREKSHYDKNEDVFIPPMAFKIALAECARFLSETIPGKGKATWTKHFEAGILCMDPIYLGVKKNDTVGESYWMNSDGKRGSGSRVLRTFPCVQEWKVKVPFYVLDQTITEPVFRKYVNEAGKFIGIGRFRPRNGGFYGRFKLANLEWHPE